VNATLQHGTLPRVWRFLRKPWHAKMKTVAVRWYMLRCNISELEARLRARLPVRLPIGIWWVPRKDNVGAPLLAGSFETAELFFAERFLDSGMTVLDVGAHHGLYTLLASKRVGVHGAVIAFEPSPRERRALFLNLVINLCWNVNVQGLALGNEETESDLYVVDDVEAGCNSLRRPDTPAKTSLTRVHVTRLDDWIANHGIAQVDFIKLDVEGAELSVLQGAWQLLERRPRPVILAEVQDVRTAPWGYRAKDIIEHLRERGYKWFRLAGEGHLESLNVKCEKFDGNFVAFPEERETTGGRQQC
jgi:FkbM family methyltransferase